MSVESEAVDRGWVVVSAAGGSGEPGQEPVEGLAVEGFTAGFGAGGEVVGEVGQGFEAVAFGGGGDGPEAGCQVGGPFGVVAVVVLAPDDRGAQGPLTAVVVEIEVGEVAVAGQAVPLAVQGGRHLGGGRVQAGAGYLRWARWKYKRLKRSSKRAVA
ncbi:MAG: hypothetical protein QG608_1823 [Actinomycetota bacterium]|nr:hypothetical protein [Actinomycetota bacterium]